jgi:tetratricopeptide (TPR) repeat protein/2-polyprenyl-3-methyl-5-hydroxy-6-metoxy-1,4-benzoquinol methylase
MPRSVSADKPRRLLLKTADQLVAQAKRALGAGELQRTAQLCRKALRQTPRHLEALHLISVVALEQQDYASAANALQRALEIAPDHGVLLSNLAAAQRGLGRLDEALASLERAAARDPTNALTQFNLGILCADSGQLERAEHCLRAAAQLAPNQAEVHLNLANVLHNQGRLSDAIASYEDALARNATLPGAHYNLGCALENLGRPQAAAHAYQQALRLDPALAQAHFNLAGVLVSAGAASEARQHLEQALETRPDWPEAHARLGALLAEDGVVDGALGHLHTALSNGPDNVVVGRYFTQALAVMGPLSYSPELASALSTCLGLPELDYQPLTSVAVAVLKQAPGFDILIEHNAKPGDAWVAALEDPTVRAWLDHELLQRVLRRALITDADFEILLSGLRAYCLDAVTQQRNDSPLPNETLLESLAHQCFINEYVFFVSANETQQLDDLQQQVRAASNTTAGVSPGAVLVLAMYQALHSLPGAERLLGLSALAPHAALLQRQIEEPIEEARLQQTIVALTTIDDAISRQVREQYEESPYPRWLSLDIQPARPLDAVMSELFPGYRPRVDTTRSLQILVAGCGTGRHAIAVARRFEGAQVLAVDLSRASLAYAMRMAAKLGVDNIEFAQADILRLGELTERFDVIESAGVLHHLAEPLQGWRQLRALLKPGGLMRIGLYSTRARHNIEHARRFVREAGYGADPGGIRQARRALLALQPEHAASPVTEMHDFYSLSACRDLIFHVQETSYTPAQIADALESLHLNLVGFDLAQRSQLDAFRRTNPDRGAMSDLAAWDAFEAAHPEAFLSMYQFWCEDAAEGAGGA